MDKEFNKLCPFYQDIINKTCIILIYIEYNIKPKINKANSVNRGNHLKLKEKNKPNELYSA